MKNPLHQRMTMHHGSSIHEKRINNIKVTTIESAIPATDCRNDSYLFDWKRNISYLVLITKDQLFNRPEN